MGKFIYGVMTNISSKTFPFQIIAEKLNYIKTSISSHGTIYSTGPKFHDFGESQRATFFGKSRGLYYYIMV